MITTYKASQPQGKQKERRAKGEWIWEISLVYRQDKFKRKRDAVTRVINICNCSLQSRVNNNFRRVWNLLFTAVTAFAEVRKPMCRLSISERHQRRCPTCCKISGDKERKLKTKRVWALNLAFCSEFYFHCGTRILGAVLHAGFPGWTVQGTAYFVIIDLVPWNRDYRESCWGK